MSEEPILLTEICKEKRLELDEAVKICKEMGIQMYSRGRGESLRYWVVRSEFIDGWLKDFRTYAVPIDFTKRKGYKPSTVKADSSDADSKWKKKYDNLKKKYDELKKNTYIGYDSLNDNEREIYDGWHSGKLNLDMGDREIIRTLRGDKDWKVGRNILSIFRRLKLFERIKK